MDGDGKRIPGHCSFDKDGPGLRMAERDLGLVSASVVGANLAGKGVFGLHFDRFARLDGQPWLVMPAELVVKRTCRQAFHESLRRLLFVPILPAEALEKK